MTLPGVFLRLTGTHPDPVLAAFLFGLAIVGAAFILSWAAEVVQLDIAVGLALALLGLIAILPEYAVDFVFTAKAGQEFAETGQATQYGPLALANMTGGNQLLIGLGWPLVILLGTYRVRKTQASPVRAEGTTATTINLDRSPIGRNRISGDRLPLWADLVPEGHADFVGRRDPRFHLRAVSPPVVGSSAHHPSPRWALRLDRVPSEAKAADHRLHIVRGGGGRDPLVRRAICGGDRRDGPGAAIVASRSVNTREAWVMLSLFVAQLLESGLAELGHISEEASAQARIGVGIVFLLAAAWVLRKDFRKLVRVVRDGLRTPWDELVLEDPKG